MVLRRLSNYSPLNGKRKDVSRATVIGRWVKYKQRRESAEANNAEGPDGEDPRKRFIFYHKRKLLLNCVPFNQEIQYSRVDEHSQQLGQNRGLWIQLAPAVVAMRGETFCGHFNLHPNRFLFCSKNENIFYQANLTTLLTPYAILKNVLRSNSSTSIVDSSTSSTVRLDRGIWIRPAKSVSSSWLLP